MRSAASKTGWLTRLMLALLLFAQAIVAANACVAADVSQAFLGAGQQADSAPCHDEDNPNGNVCLTHCTQFDQISVDQQQLPQAAPMNVFIRVVQSQPLQRIVRKPFSQTLALDTGPPIPIRFCSLLN